MPDKNPISSEPSEAQLDAAVNARADHYTPLWQAAMQAVDRVSSSCAFCAILSGDLPATVVWEDELTVAFLDLRQYHIGHVLVIPRKHVHDLRAADDDTATAVMRTTARMARAVDSAFPSEGLSIWHSIGEAANQEVPHLHFHIHPRTVDDGMLRVYAEAPTKPGRAMLEAWGAQLRDVVRQQQ